MFSAITKFFQKNKEKAKEALDFPKILILEDINKAEVKKSKTKDTKETKSTLTFGK